MSVTIKDVANRAGVSLSTVSLVINGKRNVSPDTRRKVEDAIRYLDFHPRRPARSLASRKTFNVGFILRDDHFQLTEQFYTKILLGTEFEARKLDYYIILTTVAKSFRTGAGVPRFLLEKNVDGVILAGKVPNKLIEYIRDLHIPLILVDYCPPGRREYSQVLPDNFNGAFMAVAHLISDGHRNISFVGGEKKHPSIIERFEGYEQAHKDHDMTPMQNIIEMSDVDNTVSNGYNATQDLLDKGIPFTAIFAANDPMAIGAIQCLKGRGMRIPQDVSVIGFDDIESDIQIEPRLSTVRVFKEEMGAVAVRSLVEMINDSRSSVNRHRVPVKLVLRESTGKAPEINK